jgi:hypothetical protein
VKNILMLLGCLIALTAGGCKHEEAAVTETIATDTMTATTQPTATLDTSITGTIDPTMTATADSTAGTGETSGTTATTTY